MPKQLYIPLPCAAARRQMVDRLLGESPLPCTRSYLKLCPAVGQDVRRRTDCLLRGPCCVAGDLPMRFPAVGRRTRCWTGCWVSMGPSLLVQTGVRGPAVTSVSLCHAAMAAQQQPTAWRSASNAYMQSVAACRRTEAAWQAWHQQMQHAPPSPAPHFNANLGPFDCWNHIGAA